MGLLDKISKRKSSDDKVEEKRKVDVKDEQAAAPKKATKKDDKKVDAKTASADKSTKTDKKDDKKKGVTKKVTTSLFAYEIIRQPVLTEKGDRGQMGGKYTFFVSRDANKVEIARAIRELYGVQPIAVRIMNVKGKAVRFGRRKGTRKDRKKAVITLKPGDTISVTE
jgi:large subunit ribosomal protein L23